MEKQKINPTNNLIKNHIERSIRSINKDELLNLLKDIHEYPKNQRNIKKEDLIEQTICRYDSEKTFQNQLHNIYKNTFAIHPSRLEEHLGCTKTERQRWQNEGKLPIVYYESFDKWGKTFKTPFYSFTDVLAIDEKTIKIWRNEHAETIKNNRKNATKKATHTKSENAMLREKFKQEFKNDLTKWHQTDSDLAITLELAFWTMWLSRWAKTNQTKEKHAHKKATEYENTKDRQYRQKNNACLALIRSPHTTLSFYEPENPDKTRMQLCERHYNKWCEERGQYGYVPLMDFYDDHKKEINKCPKCITDIKRHYYSLYYLQIGKENVDTPVFSFHMPYPIGKNKLPKPSELKRVEHEEQEGLFRFGRTLFKTEEVIFGEKTVEKNFDNTYTAFCERFPETNEKVSEVSK